MGEERKPEVEEGPEEQVQECCGGPEEQHEHHGPKGPHHGPHGPPDGPHGPPGGPHGPEGGPWMDRRAMMRFASMTVDEEVEFLESVKVRLEDRLKSVNERLTKLKV